MTLNRVLLAGACGMLALYAVGVVYEMDLAKPGCCGLGWPHPDPLAAARWQATADPSGKNAAVQRGAALTLLAAEPANSTAWERLAWADWLQHGRLTKVGASALDMSYAVRVYGGNVDTPWRIGFALDNWSRLSPAGRQSAEAEYNMTPHTVPAWFTMRGFSARDIGDPAGRLEAARLGFKDH